jgi:hypothetical protein
MVAGTKSKPVVFMKSVLSDEFLRQNLMNDAKNMDFSLPLLSVTNVG